MSDTIKVDFQQLKGMSFGQVLARIQEYLGYDDAEVVRKFNDSLDARRVDGNIISHDGEYSIQELNDIKSGLILPDKELEGVVADVLINTPRFRIPDQKKLLIALTEQLSQIETERLRENPDILAAVMTGRLVAQRLLTKNENLSGSNNPVDLIEHQLVLFAATALQMGIHIKELDEENRPAVLATVLDERTEKIPGYLSSLADKAGANRDDHAAIFNKAQECSRIIRNIRKQMGSEKEL